MFKKLWLALTGVRPTKPVSPELAVDSPFELYTIQQQDENYIVIFVNVPSLTLDILHSIEIDLNCDFAGADKHPDKIACLMRKRKPTVSFDLGVLGGNA